jgi:putative hydrolase of the HAD superfamily
MTRPEALVVDFGGVLTTPLQDAMIAFASEVGIELQDLVRVALAAYAGEEDSLVEGFETGAIPEEEFAREFAKRLTEVSGREVAPEGIVRKIFGGLRLEESMFDLVESARGAGLKTGLLSNSWGVNLYPKERLEGLFDAIVISGEVGLRKPDPAIFELICKQLDVAPEDVVFVDDHPGHLKTATELGMKTVLHRNPEQSIAEVQGLISGSS